MHQKKSILFSIILGVGVALSLNFVTLSDSNGSKYYPNVAQILERKSYTLCYDAKNKGPLWVYEKLLSADLSGSESRNKLKFKEDASIPVPFRSTLNDYKNSGFDRGHMCPAGDCPKSSASMQETFLLSNILPQHPSLNRGLWKALETYVRKLAESHAEVHVYTGPLFLPENTPDGKRYVTYQVIGNNDVAVPTHFFKVIRIGEGREAYIIPNRDVELSDLQSFEVPIEKLEKAVGFQFP